MQLVGSLEKQQLPAR